MRPGPAGTTVAYVPDSMAVDTAALLAAAAAIEEQTEAMVAVHACCDVAVRSALGGWIGQSRHALDELNASCTSGTASLASRLRDYSTALRSAATSFAEMDRLHARTLAE